MDRRTPGEIRAAAGFFGSGDRASTRMIERRTTQLLKAWHPDTASGDPADLHEMTIGSWRRSVYCRARGAEVGRGILDRAVRR